MEKLTHEASPNLELMILKNLHNATSSLVSAVGPMHCASQDGPMTDLFGQVLAPVSHSAARGTKKAKTMTVTSGQFGLASSASVALQQSLESRLQARLPTGGLTMFIKGWKQKVTPLGRQYCQLAVSARPINATDYGLWATPNTMDYMGDRSQEAMDRQFQTTRKGRTAPANLREQVNPAMWPTPKSGDGVFSSPRTSGRPVEKSTHLQTIAQVSMGQHGSNAPMEKRGSLNPEFVCWLMGYPTAWENCADMVTRLSRKSRRSS